MVFTTAVALVGAVAAAIVVGLRIANSGVEPEHQNWWIVAWLVVGVVDAVAGVTLVTRAGQRRLGTCLLIGGAAAVAVALAVQAGGYVATVGHLTPWQSVPGARRWGRRIAAGVIAALIPWLLVRTSRRRLHEAVWWTTVGLILLTAVGTAVGAQQPGVDVVDLAAWLVVASASAAAVTLVVAWLRAGGWDGEDPLPGWLAFGAVAAWLALVPERFDICGWRFPGVDVSVRCCCSPRADADRSACSCGPCASDPAASTG